MFDRISERIREAARARVVAVVEGAAWVLERAVCGVARGLAEGLRDGLPSSWPSSTASATASGGR